MNHIARLIIAMFMALLFSIDDFAWPAECNELFTIVEEEIDWDENHYWGILVTPYMQANGTDAMCEQFGRCVLALLDTATQMAAVEILNPPGEWVPSAQRWIDHKWALVLAGKLDMEEQAMLATQAWEWTEYGD